MFMCMVCKVRIRRARIIKAFVRVYNCAISFAHFDSSNLCISDSLHVISAAIFQPAANFARFRGVGGVVWMRASFLCVANT